MTSNSAATARYEVVIVDEDANPNDPPVHEYQVTETGPGSRDPISSARASIRAIFSGAGFDTPEMLPTEPGSVRARASKDGQSATLCATVTDLHTQDGRQDPQAFDSEAGATRDSTQDEADDSDHDAQGSIPLDNEEWRRWSDARTYETTGMSPEEWRAEGRALDEDAAADEIDNREARAIAQDLLTTDDEAHARGGALLAVDHDFRKLTHSFRDWIVPTGEGWTFDPAVARWSADQPGHTFGADSPALLRLAAALWDGADPRKLRWPSCMFNEDSYRQFLDNLMVTTPRPAPNGYRPEVPKDLKPSLFRSLARLISG